MGMDQRMAGRKAGEIMIRITQLKLWPEETEADLAARICRKLKIEEKELRSWKLTKKIH